MSSAYNKAFYSGNLPLDAYEGVTFEECESYFDSKSNGRDGGPSSCFYEKQSQPPRPFTYTRMPYISDSEDINSIPPIVWNQPQMSADKKLFLSNRDPHRIVGPEKVSSGKGKHKTAERYRTPRYPPIFSAGPQATVGFSSPFDNIHPYGTPAPPADSPAYDAYLESIGATPAPQIPARSPSPPFYSFPTYGIPPSATLINPYPNRPTSSSSAPTVQPIIAQNNNISKTPVNKLKQLKAKPDVPTTPEKKLRRSPRLAELKNSPMKNRR